MSVNYDYCGKKYFISGSEKFEFPELKRVVYAHPIYKNIIVWDGNRKKPTYNYVYKNEEQYKKALDNEIKHNDMEVKLLNERKVKLKNEYDNIINNTNIGDVFYASWGWEQTNIDFYQVVSIKGKRFGFRKLKSDCDYNSEYMSGKCKPIVNEFENNDIIEKLLSKDCTFKIDSVRSLLRARYTIKDGIKEYESHYYSCYA